MISKVLRFDPRPSGPSSGSRVLLADDDRDTVLTLGTILADEGYEVRALSDGTNAIDAVEHFDPDAIILDIEMPGRHGYELARELRARRIEDRPLLIAMSGVWVRPSERFLAIMVGFDHFFQKPTDPKELLAVLSDFRGGRRATTVSERLHGRARTR